MIYLCNLELDKSSSDVAAEGAILNEMLDIVAKRAALRSTEPLYGGTNSIESDVSRVFPVIRTAYNAIFSHPNFLKCFFTSVLVYLLFVSCMIIFQEFAH